MIGHAGYPRGLPQRVAAVVAAALLSAGCLSVGASLVPRPAGVAEKYGIPFVDPLLVTGRVRAGSQKLAGDSGTALIGNAGAGLTSAAPLANISPIEGLGPMGAIRLTSAAPLGTVALYRVLAGAGVTGPTGMYVEAVDLDDGSRVGFARLGENGSYKVLVPVADYERGLAIQVTGLGNGKITGFLAAPARVPAHFGSVFKLDITPATTALIYSKALLAGVRGEFTADKGFRGFASEGLSYLVRTGDMHAMIEAAGKLDSAPDMQEFENGDRAQAVMVSLAEKLARATAKHGLAAGSTFLHMTAAAREMIRQVTRSDGTEPAQAIVDSAGERVLPQYIAVQIENLEKQLEGDEWGEVTVTPTPVPAPTPSPGSTGPSPDGSASAGPTAGPSDGPSPGPTASGSASPDPSGTPSVDPSASPSPDGSSSPGTSPAPTAGPTSLPTSSPSPGGVTVPGIQVPGSGNALSDYISGVTKSPTPGP